MRYLVLSLLLAGCGLNPEYMAQKRDSELQANAASCEKLGFAKGSKENADCALRMYQASRPAVVGGSSVQPARQPQTCIQTGNVMQCN